MGEWERKVACSFPLAQSQRWAQRDGNRKKKKGMGIETRVGPGLSGQSGVLTGRCSTRDSGQRPEAWQGVGGGGVWGPSSRAQEGRGSQGRGGKGF